MPLIYIFKYYVHCQTQISWLSIALSTTLKLTSSCCPFQPPWQKYNFPINCLRLTWHKKWIPSPYCFSTSFKILLSIPPPNHSPDSTPLQIHTFKHSLSQKKSHHSFFISSPFQKLLLLLYLKLGSHLSRVTSCGIVCPGYNIFYILLISQAISEGVALIVTSSFPPTPLATLLYLNILLYHSKRPRLPSWFCNILLDTHLLLSFMDLIDF